MNKKILVVCAGLLGASVAQAVTFTNIPVDSASHKEVRVLVQSNFTLAATAINAWSTNQTQTSLVANVSTLQTQMSTATGNVAALQTTVGAVTSKMDGATGILTNTFVTLNSASNCCITNIVKYLGVP